MKISEHWLRAWSDPPVDAPALAEKLTLAGLEVDGVDPVGGGLSGVIVAEVLEVERHPDAERLSVCRVRDAEGESRVVCGAPNVRAGLLTAYARPGARLPGAGRIDKTTIRGVESAGMLCSAAELGLGDDADGIIELDADAVIGATIDETLGLDDLVFDIGLTPNRGDCFCVLGVAREVAVLTGAPCRAPAVEAVTPVVDDVLRVELATPRACSRYAGRVIRGIDPRARTPLWMQERLRRVGVRAIHPVVDVTNYVMLELGQPMHAFDLARIDSNIVVREAVVGETLELLDGQALDLDAGTLVIADAARPVALAGVMGGAASGVSDETCDIFLESAFFDPIRLAGVARHYRLQTDASTRFERGVDPTHQERAVERATALIVEICGGQPGPTTCTEDLESVPSVPCIEFRPERVNRLLGTCIETTRIAEILESLELEVVRAAEPWQVTPPPFRFDLAIEADLVEEVARIEGYDRIPATLPRGEGEPAVASGTGRLETAAAENLMARGYHEAITYSFVAAERAELFHPDWPTTPLANPISSEMAIMRPSLLPGLVDAAVHNLNRQHDTVQLFELGMVFADDAGQAAQRMRLGGVRAGLAAAPRWTAAARETDFFDIKQDVECILSSWGWEGAAFIADSQPGLHPGQTARIEHEGRVIGRLGALHPATARRLDISKPLFLFDLMLPEDDSAAAPQYVPISRFPAVRRDLNIVVDETVTATDCLAAAREAAGTMLHDLQLFDVYRGQGIDSDKKSLTLGLIFQVASSTLTDDEVEAAMDRVLAKLAERVGGVLRN